ncbi:MAG: DNA polymerase I [Spirochaetes bacterium GWD1_27_9]|nr:MAG: DNA polymerase I [Spirochaetes bacterium GWB1_27_13]OHD26086.1 MAG: DNA polymerase I [Spirochaetes bacterium GWC1_27_15]OHD41253.1 MAG: DNA polymerase I [Spirochaetes bacterium GWD1_27_9]
MKKFLIIDAFGLIFKSYYAFISRPLTNRNGENTSAIFGFFKSLVGILKKEKPDYILVALEGAGECFRNKIYPEYKANRDEAPADLKSQIPKIINLLEKLNIPHIHKESFEADDIIGTVANKFATEEGKEAIILSSDKDLMQLITDKVFMYKPSKNSSDFNVLTPKAVFDEIGIKPSQVVDYLALIGDASDNIPGVGGIGPKSAVVLLEEWENLDNIYNNIDKITGKVKEKLLKDKESAFLSQKLATIEKNIDFEFNIEDFGIKPLNIKDTKQLLEDDNLKSVILDIEEYNLKIFGEKPEIIIPKEEIKPKDLKLVEYKLLFKEDDLKKFVSDIKETGYFSFDLETTGFDFFKDSIICMSIATSKMCTVIPFHLSLFQQGEIEFNITKDYIDSTKSLLKTIFEDESITKIGQNIKFDIKFLKTFGIETKGDCFDTMLAEYCLDASHNILGVKDLSEKYLGHKMIRYEEVVGDTKKNTLQDVPVKNLVEYSGQDAYLTYKLHEILKEKLRESKKIEELFYLIEMPLMKILIDMEYTGVFVDKDYLFILSSQLESDIDLLNTKLQDFVDEPFNPASPKQVAEILFNKLNLPPIKATKTGQSTDVDVLKKLAVIHPFASILLEYRTLTKIKSTYSDSLPQMINSVTKKVHTTYMQTGTQTGRLSSKDPNLQNIPIKTEIGRKIRKSFVPTEGNLILSADYSQIELFLLAEFSKDEHLFNAFNNNEDIHSKTASLIFGKNIDEVTKQERTIGKTVNFGVLYGQGAFALAEDLNIQRKEAADFIDKYFKSYAGIAVYIEQIKENCRKNGFVETHWGRKRTIPEINDKNKLRQANGERMAVNTTIQGTAADLIKIAMIRIFNKFNEEKIRSKLVMQVHDELIFDVYPDEKDRIIMIIKESMENGFDFKLQLKTSVEIGQNWGDLH